MRRKEILTLQWRDVDLTRGRMTFRAENVKTQTTLQKPISPRLRAVLKMIEHDPAGILTSRARMSSAMPSAAQISDPAEAAGQGAQGGRDRGSGVPGSPSRGRLPLRKSRAGHCPRSRGCSATRTPRRRASTSTPTSTSWRTRCGGLRQQPVARPLHTRPNRSLRQHVQQTDDVCR